MTNILDKLNDLEAKIFSSDAHEAHKAAANFERALVEAWPLLRGALVNHVDFVKYCESRFTWSAKPDEWEYITDGIMLDKAHASLDALEIK